MDSHSQTGLDHKGRPKIFFLDIYLGLFGSRIIDEGAIMRWVGVKMGLYRRKYIGTIDINNTKIYRESSTQGATLDTIYFFRDKIPESKRYLRHILVDIKEYLYFSTIYRRHTGPIYVEEFEVFNLPLYFSHYYCYTIYHKCIRRPRHG